MPSEPLLQVTDLHRHFGGLRAVDGISLDIQAARITAIIGPNGAGKTTLFNLLSGAIEATAGAIRFDGHDITRLPAHERAQLGLARTFQIPRPLPRLTVEENLRLAAPAHRAERWWSPLVDPSAVRRRERGLDGRVEEMLRLFELADHRNDYAGALSGGQKKLLELARALMTRPRLVLLDEPMAGVNPTLARHIMEKVEELRRQEGVTFVLVEHDLETVFRHCEPIIVMANGRKLAEGPAAQLRQDPAVIEAYLGG